jgi:hypothetical protein
MSDSPGTDASTGEQPVSFSMEIRDGRTEIRVSGDRDTSVVVQSESGEKIYLPPEDFDRPPGDGTAYESPHGSGTAYESPYQPGSGSQESPYDTGPDADSVVGLEPTADGYLVVHPEPVTDVRFLR